MAKKSLKNLIEENYDSLSRTQKKIADFLLNSPDVIMDMKGKYLSDILEISESSVVRFAQTIGLEGYPDLVLLINDHIKNTRTSIERLNIGYENSYNNASYYSIEEEIIALKKVRDHISKKEMSNVVNKLNSAKRIFVLGCRSSHYLASYFSFYLNFIKPNVYLLGKAEISIIEELVDVSEDDVIFTFSFPRYTKALTEIVQFVKNRGAQIILLTDSENNSNAKYSDITLRVPNNILFFVDSLVVPMAVINSLIINLSLLNKQNTINSLTNMEAIWKEYDIFESNKYV